VNTNSTRRKGGILPVQFTSIRVRLPLSGVKKGKVAPHPYAGIERTIIRTEQRVAETKNRCPKEDVKGEEVREIRLSVVGLDMGKGFASLEEEIVRY